MKRFYFIAVAVFSFLFFTDQLSAQPTAVCANDLTLEFPSRFSDSIELWPADFDLGSFSQNSQIIDWQINFVYDLNGNQIIDKNEEETSPPGTNRLFFTNADIGTYYVQLWVIDENAAVDYCITSIEVKNRFFFADNQSVLGRIEHPDGSGIEGINVELNNYDMNILTKQTDSEGDFLMHRSVRMWEDYTIVPMSDSNWMEGVNDSDIDAIIAHIIGNEILDSPYKLIAADVNNDGKVSVADIQVLRKNILGLSVGFPNNKAWRFVVKGYFFTPVFRPAVPINFPEMISLNNIQHNEEDVDFIGIKIGDVTE